MHRRADGWKSDRFIVPLMPSKEPPPSVGTRRAEGRDRLGNILCRSTRLRAQNRLVLSLDHVRVNRVCCTRALGGFREEPSAGKPHARICEGESLMADLLDYFIVVRDCSELREDLYLSSYDLQPFQL